MRYDRISGMRESMPPARAEAESKMMPAAQSSQRPATKPTQATSNGGGETSYAKKMCGLLNEDLAREYQAVHMYVCYSQVMKGAGMMHIASDFEAHASEELGHAVTLTKIVDYLGGYPETVAKPVKQSEDCQEMLQEVLRAENEAVTRYKQRIKQCEEAGYYAISDQLRDIISDEQGHQIDVAAALGEDVADLVNPGEMA